VTAHQRNLSTFAGAAIAAILLVSAAYLANSLRHAPPIPALTAPPTQIFLQPIDVPLAELPWKRDPDHPERLTSYVSMAILPRLPLHHDPADPVRIFLRPAEVPWTRQVPDQPIVRHEIARVPHLPIHRDLQKPDSIDAPIAALPWTRTPPPPHPPHHAPTLIS
jgi:hypothetical protein